MLSVSSIHLDSFQIEVSEERNSLSLRLSGTGDMAAVEPLKECLGQVRNDMARLGLKRTDIDIRALYLLNSSCIKAFVRFIYSMQTDGPQFPLRFVVDGKLSWQARALSAFTRMAPDLVTVEAV